MVLVLAILIYTYIVLVEVGLSGGGLYAWFKACVRVASHRFSASGGGRNTSATHTDQAVTNQAPLYFQYKGHKSYMLKPQNLPMNKG